MAKLFTFPDKNSMRNLKQFRDLPEEEFEEIYSAKITTGIIPSAEFEKRIEKKINEFAVDYDIDDLKANDKLVLRALAQAYITLEDLNQAYYKLTLDGVNLEQIIHME